MSEEEKEETPDSETAEEASEETSEDSATPIETEEGAPAESEEESEDEDVDFAHDVLDVLVWVLGGISTGDFKVEPYLNIAAMKEIVEDIKARTEEETEAE